MYLFVLEAARRGDEPAPGESRAGPVGMYNRYSTTNFAETACVPV